MEPIEDYLFCDYHEPTNITRNIKFTSIPPDFEIVIKKMNPEITGIRMIRTEATKMIIPINISLLAACNLSIFP